MSLNQFSKEFPPESKMLHVVICVAQKPIGIADKSPVNQLLREVQQQLKRELVRYREIQIAFVFETPDTEVKDFQKLRVNTPIYYKEPTSARRDYNLAHVWLMGLALLEKKQYEIEGKKDLIENRLYLVTDEKVSYNKAKLAVMEVGGRLCVHPRFGQLKFQPVLFRSKDGNADILEKYIRQEHGECKMLEGNELIDIGGWDRKWI